LRFARLLLQASQRELAACQFALANTSASLLDNQRTTAHTLRVALLSLPQATAAAAFSFLAGFRCIFVLAPTGALTITSINAFWAST